MENNVLTGQSLQRCPYIGPFGFCENSGCSKSINGICWWLNANSTITYSNNTSAPTDEGAKE